MFNQLKIKAIGIKHHIKDRFKGSWKNADKWITLIRLGMFFIRGCYQRLFFGTSKGLVLTGSRVSVRYAKYLHAGSDLIIEDGTEINCLSHEGIHLGNRVTIGKYAIIRPSNIYGGEIGEGLRVGDHSNIGPYSYIGCSGLISIGNNVMISPRVSIYAENHVFEDPEVLMKDQGVIRKKVVIEDDCWIASNSIILAGVTVGKGSVVAAGSVVTHDVPPYSIVAGVPAKIIKKRKNNA